MLFFISTGIPDNFEHATGLEKKELDRIKAGDSVSTTFF